MNTKGMMAAIVTAMLVMTMFAVMIGPAAALNYSIGKSTLTAPGGSVDNGLEYIVGQQVNYSMHFMPTSENCRITSVKDIFPDGTVEDLAPGSYPILLDQHEWIGWETTWVVNSGGIDSNGKIVNNLEVEGFDADNNPFIATAPKSSNSDEPPEADCSFTQLSCGQGTLSGTGSSDDGVIVEYAWDFYNDGTYDAYGENVLYDIVGTHDVRLMVADNLGQTDNCTLSVTLTCGPIADAKADGSDGPVQLPQGGKLVTFCGDESYHPDAAHGANIISYHWTILGVDYSTTDEDECFDVFIDETTTAYLKVVDNFACEHIDTVTLRVPLYKPPSDVPILTPTGMVALIGMLCIVGAGRILTKGRRL